MSDKFFGEVIWFDPKQGIGFIDWERDGVKQKDMFVHYSDISCQGYKTLYKGQKVSFGIGVNNKSEPKAVDVLVLKN